MHSFDVSSLFTNVPLDEIIKISLEALYDASDSLPVIPKDVFVELVKSATSLVKFSFNDTTHKQTNGVAMGSPPDPALTNIFVGYYEEKLFSETRNLPVYFRYVDNTFATFYQKAEADEFVTKLNCFHPSLKLFLDVGVERTDTGFEINEYQNTTFTGQYLRWQSFSSLLRKMSLIFTLVHRALIIWAKRRLNGEIERVKKILLDNGYAENVVNAHIAKKNAQFSTFKRFGPEKCPVYFRVSWMNKPSTIKKRSRNSRG